MDRIAEDVSVEEIVRIMMAGFGAPPYAPPRACLALMFGCMQHFRQLRVRGEVLSQNFPELLAMWMQFLTTPRTADEFDDLTWLWIDCECHAPSAPALVRNAPAFLHTYARAQNRTEKEQLRLVTMTVDLMCMYLSSQFPGEDISNRLFLATPNAPVQVQWPRHVQDIMPYGPDVMWKSLGQWAELKTGHLTQLGGIYLALLQTFKVQFLPHLLSSDSAWIWIRRLIAGVKEEFDDPASGTLTAMVIDHGLDSLHQAAHLSRLITLILFDDEIPLWVTNSSGQTLKQVLQVLFEGADCAVKGFYKLGMRDMREYPRAHEHHVNAVTRFYSQANRILLVYPETLRDAEIPRDLKRTFIAKRHEFADPLHQLVKDAMEPTPWAFRCHGPGCNRAEPDEGRKFKRCADCRKTFYCSRRCQRMGWRFERAPHREICETMQVFRVLERRVARRQGPDREELSQALMRRVPEARVAAALESRTEVHRSQLESMQRMLAVRVVPDTKALIVR
jgi:hypothetical protein